MNNELTPAQTQTCPLCSTKVPPPKELRVNLNDSAIKIGPDLRHKHDTEGADAHFPLIHDLRICNNCYYSTLAEDFLLAEHTQEALIENTHIRQNLVHALVEDIDFHASPTAEHGMLGYILAVECYQFFGKAYNPTFKKAVCSLRASWLAKDLYIKTEQKLFQTIQAIFQRKAAKYYNLSLHYAQDNTEAFNAKNCAGPDVRQQWGYSGLIYLVGYFNYLLALREKDESKIVKTLDQVKQLMDKVQELSTSDTHAQTILKFSRNIKRLSNEKLKNIAG